MKELIQARYKSLRDFSIKIGMPYSTMDSIFKRGVKNASVTNIIKVCEELGIYTDGLAKGEIIYKSTETEKAPEITPEGRYAGIIKKLDLLKPVQLAKVEGFIDCMVMDNEAAETAKQISDQLA